MSGKNWGKRSIGDIWWWSEEVKEAVMCQNNTEENKRRYKSMKNKAKKAVSESIRELAEEAFTE